MVLRASGFDIHNARLRSVGKRGLGGVGVLGFGTPGSGSSGSWVMVLVSGFGAQSASQNNGPISYNREYKQYRVHYFGHFGGPSEVLGSIWRPPGSLRLRCPPALGTSGLQAWAVEAAGCPEALGRASWG